MTSWFLPEHTWAVSMGYEELPADVSERMRRSVRDIPTPQYDTHVQAWHKLRDQKASEVLSWMYINRTTKDWDK
jgi:hypothetical protein